MKLSTACIFAISSWVFASTAMADPTDFELGASNQCSAGNAINGITVYDVTGDAGGSTDCWGTTDGNDVGPGSTFTIDGMIFDYITKIEINDDGDNVLDPSAATQDIGLIVGGGEAACSSSATSTELPGSSGCWAYDGNLFHADAFIIVLKAGDHPGFAAWLFLDDDANSTSGFWNISWKNNDPGGCCSNLSHFSIYAKGVTVPEPGTLLLLGLGLIGAGFSRRRTKK